MDWMDIGSNQDTSSRLWPKAVVGIALVAGIAVAIALPNVIPSRHAAQQDQAQESQAAAQGLSQDEGADVSSVSKVTIVGADTLTGLSADQVSSLSAGLASWMTSQGIADDATVTLVKEPAAKGGATVLEVSVDGLEQPVACSWRDHSWTFAPASAIDGRDDATVRTTDAAKLADTSGEVGIYDAKRLAALVGDECAQALTDEWADYATKNGYAGPNDAVVDVTSIKADEKKVSFSIVAPKAKDGFSEDVIDVSYDVAAGTFEMKAR